jgi:hypothetical protein
MRRSFRRLFLVFVLGVVWSATPAGAATTCSFNPGTDTVTVTMTTPDVVQISQAGGFLQVNSGPAGDPVPCIQGPAPMGGIDTVTVTDTSGGDSSLTLLEAERFRPGNDPEPDGTSEIEFTVNLGTGTGDLLSVVAFLGEADNAFRFGTAGANFNDDADADATLSGIERLEVNGKRGNDFISGLGGFGTGDPYPGGMIILGIEGNDSLSGSTARTRSGGSMGTTCCSAVGDWTTCTATRATTSFLDTGGPIGCTAERITTTSEASEGTTAWRATRGGTTFGATRGRTCCWGASTPTT